VFFCLLLLGTDLFADFSLSHVLPHLMTISLPPPPVFFKNVFRQFSHNVSQCICIDTVGLVREVATNGCQSRFTDVLPSFLWVERGCHPTDQGTIQGIEIQMCKIVDCYARKRLYNTTESSVRRRFHIGFCFPSRGKPKTVYTKSA